MKLNLFYLQNEDEQKRIFFHNIDSMQLILTNMSVMLNDMFGSEKMMTSHEQCPKCGKSNYSPDIVLIQIGRKKEKYAPIAMKCSDCGYFDKKEAIAKAEKMRSKRTEVEDRRCAECNGHFKQVNETVDQIAMECLGCGRIVWFRKVIHNE